MPAGDDDLDDLFADAPGTAEQADDASPVAFDDLAPDAESETPEDAAAPESDASEAEKTADETTATPAPVPERPRGPKKPMWDIYTAMLALTLVAILFGCVFLILEWSRYGFQTTPGP